MSTKEVKVKVTGDVSDLLKKLEQAKNSIEDLGKGVNKSTNKGIDSLNNDLDELRKNAERTADSLDDLYNATKKPSKNNFSGMADDITDVSKKINIAVDDIKDFSKQVDLLDNASLDKLNRSMTDANEKGSKISNTFEELKENYASLYKINLSKFNSDINNAASSSEKLGSSFVGTVAKTALFGTATYKAAASAADLSKKIKQTFVSYKQGQAEIKAINEELGVYGRELTNLSSSITRSNQDVQNLATRLGELKADFDSGKISIDDYENELSNLREEVRSARSEQEEQASELKRLASVMEPLIERKAELVKQGTKEEQQLKQLVNDYNKVAAAAREHGEAINDINYDELISKGKKVSDTVKDISSSQKDGVKASGSWRQSLLDKLKDLDDQSEKTKKSFSGMFDGLKNTKIGNVFGKIKESMDKLKTSQEEAKKSSKDFSEALKSIGDVISKVKSKDFSGAFKALKASASSATGSLVASIGVIAGVGAALNGLYESGKKQFFEGLSNIKSKLQPAIDAIKSFGREAITAFESITNTQLDLSSLMQVGPEFEYQMQRVGSIAGSNDKQLQQLTDTASKLGGTTQFTASQVGEAFEYMAMAGYSTEEMLASIDDTLNLAIISGGDLGTVSDIVTDGLTALGMSAADTGEFVDKMAATITSSNTTVELFGETLKQVGALAGSLGIDMTDLSTATGLMANAGVKGSRAGTSLKNVLSNMAAPTDKQAAALQKLGLTADETGSYLKTTADGNVDLAATMKSLMTATEGMDKTQQAAILTQIAGKEAVAGLMSIMNQGEAAWDELSTTIENSTGKVQYWNECMSLAGKSGDEAVKLIDNMKQVFSEVESEAQAAGLSTEDLSNAIALLGDDGKVTADNVRDLINVLDDMGTATGKQEEKWRALDKTGKSAVNTNFDYDATVAAITADTQGLTQAQKENMIAELGKAKTYEEAVKIGEKYSQGNIDMTKTIERASFANMSYAEKLDYLRDNLKGLSEEERRAALESLGLSSAFDEVNEICDMSDKEFDAYTKNLETIQSMSEQLANAMDEVTKGSLLSLASAILNVARYAFDSLKPAIQNASDALTEFFDTWHNGDKNEFTFTGLENGLKGLEQKVRGAIPNIQQAVADLFSGLDRFVNGGSLDSILKIGTDVVTGICDGIKKSYDSGTLTDAISGAIKKICDFITKNGPQIREAGKDILDALMKGIEENQDAIYDAMDVVCDIIEDYIDGEGKMDGVMSKFGSRLMELGAKSIKSAIKTKVKEEWNKFFGGLFDFDLTKKPTGGGIFTNGNLANLIFGDFDPIKDIKNWFKDKFKGFNLMEFIKGLFIKPGTGKSGPKTIGMGINVGDLFGKLPTAEEAKKWIQDKIGNWHPIQWIKDKIFKGGTTSKSQDSGNSAIKPEQLIKLPSLGDFKNWIQSKVGNWHPIQWIKEKLFGKGGTTSKSQDSGNSAIKPEQLIKLPSLDEIKGWIEGKIGDFHPIKWIQEKWNQVKDFGNDALKWVDNLIPDDLGTKISEKIEKVLGDNWFTDTIGKILGKKDGKKADVKDLLNIDNTKLEETKKVLESLGETATAQAGVVKTAFTDIQNSARTSFVGLSDIARNQFINVSNIVRNQMVNCANIVRNQAVNMANIFRNQFVNMSNIVRNQAVNMANIMRNQMVNCANIVRNQCVNMANIFRNQFVSMANVARNQMVNVSNIIRNQAVNWSNIIRNQVQSARNTMTSSFISMRNVARNQMVAISNIIRNQAVTWSNIIRNQAANMRSAMTSAFAGMAASARAGMANVLSVVRSYMAQIRSETSKTMTMHFKVDKTVTTTNVSKNVTEGLRNTMGAISRGMASISAPQAISIGGYATSMSSIGGLAAGGSITLDVPLYIDGKEVARATAVYNEQELAKLAKRNNRKRGE